jgi:hypothetical protein
MKTTVFLLAGIFITFFFTSCSLQDDNIVEESAEEVLRMKTGLDVDFTPKSPENLYHKLIVNGNH